MLWAKLQEGDTQTFCTSYRKRLSPEPTSQSCWAISHEDLVLWRRVVRPDSAVGRWWYRLSGDHRCAWRAWIYRIRDGTPGRTVHAAGGCWKERAISALDRKF